MYEKQIQNHRYYIKSIAECIQFLSVNELGFCITYDEDLKTNLVYFKIVLNFLLKNAKLKEIVSTIAENAKYTSPNIQNEIIELMSTIVIEKIINNI